jgi:hypothetical protein
MSQKNKKNEQKHEQSFQQKEVDFSKLTQAHLKLCYLLI